MSEHERAEHAFPEGETPFRILDSLPVLVWMSDRDNRCTYFNRPWLEFTGRRLEEEIDNGWAERVHPDDLERSLRTFTTAFDRREPFQVEYRLRRADGEYRWLLNHGVPLYASGGAFAGYVGSCIDITERKAAEGDRESALAREQAARAQAETLSGLKDEFLNTLSHELRTPLNSILGWVKMLRTPRLDEARARHALEVIERNVNTQSRLITGLLDTSRALSGKVTLVRSAVDLRHVVDAAVDALRPAAEAKRIQMLSSLAELEPTWADPTRLHQIVWNLVSNAVRFTPKGGRIEISLRGTDGGAAIAVRDTGQGIEANFLPHLFERFRRGDVRNPQTQGGLGLGLALVRHLVELHGGTVRAESGGEGKGAVFTVTIPLVKPPEGEKLSRVGTTPSVPRHLGALLGVEVLVVDDDADTCDLLAAVLSRHGATVRTVRSVPEARTALQTRRPHVLVCDIVMPGENGLTLIREVRSRTSDWGGTLPAVALTAYARPEDRAESIAAGFQAYFAKPVEPGDLVETLAALVGRESAI